MFEQLFKNIFFLKRSLLGKENNKALAAISKEVPLKMHSFRSESAVFDWTIPKEWILKKATLKTEDGTIICDASKNILRVVSHSAPCNKTLTYDELVKHLHYSDQLEDAIPYRTSYYSKSWGFCLTKTEYDSLDKNCKYVIDIESEFVDSFLNIGELKIPGKSEKEIIFTSYICHPMQANDGLSGVFCLLELYKKLIDRDNFYTYRFFFLPETIGPITLLANSVIDKNNVDLCLVCTCVGHGKTINYKKTFLGDHPFDNIVLQNDYIKQIDFFPNGSDERQLSSPKIRIPTASIMRAVYGDYKEYHTSLDNLQLVDYKNIKKIVDLYYNCLIDYEQRECFIIAHDGAEPFLAAKNLYRKTGGPADSKWDKLRNWVIFLSDGEHSILDMHKKTNFSFEELKKCAIILLESGVILTEQNEHRNSSRERTL